ncbi:hypothetical protein AB1Y20_012865 [Prymnesium parvum]|uniref:V-SNARE coiled-coil homology domain-containing protein n=1 Tax=Prymnesium parvum TaxID=97485 RepID=A0AB34ILI1_PRYPA
MAARGVLYACVVRRAAVVAHAGELRRERAVLRALATPRAAWSEGGFLLNAQGEGEAVHAMLSGGVAFACCASRALSTELARRFLHEMAQVFEAQGGLPVEEGGEGRSAAGRRRQAESEGESEGESEAGREGGRDGGSRSGSRRGSRRGSRSSDGGVRGGAGGELGSGGGGGGGSSGGGGGVTCTRCEEEREALPDGKARTKSRRRSSIGWLLAREKGEVRISEERGSEDGREAARRERREAMERLLEQLMQRHSNPERIARASQVAEVVVVVQETAGIMQDNLARLLANYEDVDALADKSAQLMEQSQFLHAAARQLKVNKCRQNWKMNLCFIIPIVAGLVVLILWAAKVIKF